MLPIFSLQKRFAVRKRFIALLLPFLLFLGLLIAAHPGLAQSPLPTPPPPTQPPAIMIIQPTATPAPTPQGSLLRQVWEENQKAIILAVITTVLTSILIGVFLRRIADTLADWASRFFHLSSVG
jgi:hypothetical protein